MHLDVIDLRAFYARSPLGRIAQSRLRTAVSELWPSEPGQTLAGFGFAHPVLRPFMADARRVISFMPQQQGVVAWPERDGNVSVLVEETNWPLQPGCVDRLIVMHGLETSERPSALLEEIWRVLAPGGRVLFIVPNRSGLWSRRDATPFGFGRPYSLGQLERSLRDHRFSPERHIAALYAPPSQTRFWRRAAPIWEKVGRKLTSRLAGGVLIVEASKQVYAQTPKGLSETVRRPLGVLEGIGRPAPKPASGRDWISRDSGAMLRRSEKFGQE